MKFYKFLDEQEKKLGEALGTSRPRSGGGKHGDFITARLRYYDDLKKEGKSDKEAFAIVSKADRKQLKKLGY